MLSWFCPCRLFASFSIWSYRNISSQIVYTKGLGEIFNGNMVHICHFKTQYAVNRRVAERNSPFCVAYFNLRSCPQIPVLISMTTNPRFVNESFWDNEVSIKNTLHCYSLKCHFKCDLFRLIWETFHSLISISNLLSSLCHTKPFHARLGLIYAGPWRQ